MNSFKRERQFETRHERKKGVDGIFSSSIIRLRMGTQAVRQLSHNASEINEIIQQKTCSTSNRYSQPAALAIVWMIACSISFTRLISRCEKMDISPGLNLPNFLVSAARNTSNEY